MFAGAGDHHGQKAGGAENGIGQGHARPGRYYVVAVVETHPALALVERGRKGEQTGGVPVWTHAQNSGIETTVGKSSA